MGFATLSQQGVDAAGLLVRGGEARASGTSDGPNCLSEADAGPATMAATANEAAVPKVRFPDQALAPMTA